MVGAAAELREVEREVSEGVMVGHLPVVEVVLG